MEKGNFSPGRGPLPGMRGMRGTRGTRSGRSCGGGAIMTGSLEVLTAHAARTLPDSLRGRKTVLRALEKVLHADHPAHRDVRAQLAGLDAVEKLNSQLETYFDPN
jgi:hypothetical protein